MDRKLNYEHVFSSLVKGLGNYVTSNHMDTMVLGISGGIDSTIVAAIAKQVSQNTDVKLIGISLMCSTNQLEEVCTADAVGKEFCDEYYKININSLYEAASSEFKNGGITKGYTTPIAEGNIKARLRMMYLWHIGGLRNGLVLDTDIQTEHLLGFFTIMGDTNYLTPIGELWKSEVYKLGQYLIDNVYKGSEALKMAMMMIPTDGNGISSSDLEQIGGKSYDEVDDILYTWYSLAPQVREKMSADNLTESIKGSVFDITPENEKKKKESLFGGNKSLCTPTLGDKYGVETVRKIILRSIRSEFKRKHTPLKIDLMSGTIIEQ